MHARRDPESMRVFLERMARAPLLEKEEESDLANRYRADREAFRTAALTSRAAAKKVREWDAAMREGILTAKELMPRGRRTKRELDAFRRKVGAVARACRRGSLAGRAKIAALPLKDSVIRKIAATVKEAGLKRRLAEITERKDAARDALIRANLRLVISVAKNPGGTQMDFFDRVQEGCLGLGRAVDRFDPDKGFRFSTYAVWWIRQAINRAAALQDRTVRVPAHMLDLMSKADKLTARYREKFQREPNPEDIRKRLKLSPLLSEALQTLMTAPIPLSTTVSPESDRELAETIPDECEAGPMEHASRSLRRDEIDKVLRVLDDREAGILRLRFGLDDGRDRTLDEVGRHLNVTRERVRQIEVCALKKLRNPAVSSGLRDYWM